MNVHALTTNMATDDWHKVLCKLSGCVDPRRTPGGCAWMCEGRSVMIQTIGLAFMEPAGFFLGAAGLGPALLRGTPRTRDIF